MSGCCQDKQENLQYRPCMVCVLLWNDTRPKVVKCCPDCHVYLCASGHNWIDRGMAALKKRLMGVPNEC